MTILQSADPADVGMSAARLKNVSNLTASWIQPGLHQAIVALVARRGGVVLKTASGLQSPGGTQLTPDTVFPIASNSKVITATAVMLLVERGLVSLNTPISDFFPGFTGKHKNEVRLWHLLTHNRIVKRPLTAPGARVADTWFFDGIEGKCIRENPWAYGSVVSTATDMGIFCQMFLNKGSYGDERILSPATVSEMTRNQTEGLIDLDREGPRPVAARGLGWDLPARKNSLLYASLYSTQTVKHSGAGGSMMWIDPVNELIGVFLSVELDTRADGQRHWRGDCFANAVTASVVHP